MTAVHRTDRDPLRTVQQVAPLLPDLPWLALLDAVEEGMSLAGCCARARTTPFCSNLRDYPTLNYVSSRDRN